MDVSKFLSKALGIYLIIVCVAMLMDMQHFITLTNALMNDAPLLFITGIFTLVLGVLMVVSHNIWQLHWRVIITIFCWVALIKGALILIYPHFFNHAIFLFFQNMNVAYITASIDLVIGILLTYFGFKR